ncbi:MAG: FAD-dependent oxidoreductase [Actinomycetota bacterium]|nr:FAD-dependent oxidoreductase [Actinomycetota bacterium]
MTATTNQGLTDRAGTRRDVDVAVVGGGLAGLATATLAARRGLTVALFEQQTLGGRARSSTTETGFTLNQGPHALYVSAAGRPVLEACGVEPRGGAPSTKGALGSRDGTVGLLPGGVGSLVRSRLLSGRAKPGLAWLLATFARRRPSGSMSAAEWFASLSGDADVWAMFAALTRLTCYVADTEAVSADVAHLQIGHALGDGVQYLDGGWQQLVDGLAAQAQAAGVDIVEHGRVTEVSSGVVRHDGGEVRARAVIVAGLSPRAAASVVSGAPDLSDAAGPPVEAATLDLGVRGLPEHSFVLGIDEPLYCSRHDPPADLAPEGHSLYGLMRYLRPGEHHDRHETAAELEAHAAHAGLAAGDIVERRYQHRLTVAHGMPLAARGGLSGRPGVDALGVPGVYLAGDWVGPDGMLADASLASAAAAVEAAGRRLATQAAA